MKKNNYSHSRFVSSLRNSVPMLPHPHHVLHVISTLLAPPCTVFIDSFFVTYAPWPTYNTLLENFSFFRYFWKACGCMLCGLWCFTLLFEMVSLLLSVQWLCLNCRQLPWRWCLKHAWSVSTSVVVCSGRPCYHGCLFYFLADRTNGRAIATLFRLSVRLSVCRLWRYVLWLNGAS